MALDVSSFEKTMTYSSQYSRINTFPQFCAAPINPEQQPSHYIYSTEFQNKMYRYHLQYTFY